MYLKQNYLHSIYYINDTGMPKKGFVYMVADKDGLKFDKTYIPSEAYVGILCKYISMIVLAILALFWGIVTLACRYQKSNLFAQ